VLCAVSSLLSSPFAELVLYDFVSIIYSNVDMSSVERKTTERREKTKSFQIVE